MLMRKLIENSKVFSLNIYHEVHDIEQNDYCHPIKQEMYQKRGCTMRGSIEFMGQSMPQDIWLFMKTGINK